MTYSSIDEAELWAKKQMASEGEAFEKALQRIAPHKIIDALQFENESLKIQIARLTDENKKLKEALRRSSMD